MTPIIVKSLPNQPGCYIFKGRNQEIIYVGKAKELKKRVSSYFQKKEHDNKTAALISEIADLDFIVTDSELEALLLEARLIRLHRPKFNIDLKDSVRYAYLKITKEKFPRLITVRQIDSDDAKYFGPYQDGSTRETAARMARQIFKLRTCGDKLPHHVCLQYYLKRCDAPCIAGISESEYSQNVKKASQFLKGKTGFLKKQLLKEMKIFSSAQDYEKAKQRRDQAKAIEKMGQTQKVMLLKNYNEHLINYSQLGGQTVLQLFSVEKGSIANKQEFRLVSSPMILEEFIKQFYLTNEIPDQIIVPDQLAEQDLIEKYLKKIKGKSVRVVRAQKGNKAKLLDMVKNNILMSIRQENQSLVDLKEVLFLNSIPNIIECFDISNIGDQWVVGSMVQFIGGLANKNNYRKFKIRTVAGQNDFASMAEVVRRRYKRLLDENQSLPDLIVIDGGKGQLQAAFNALIRLNLKLPIISLAKKFEEIYTINEDKPIRLSRKSQALKLLQRVRDEAHRFAVKYHRYLRSRSELS